MNRTEMSDKEFKLLSDFIYQQVGIHMNESKKLLLTNRLSKRLKELELDSYKDYYHYLAHSSHGSEELGYFIDAITTNETYFFRAPKIWNYFTKTYLPTWTKNHPHTTLKIWCAAASSGEEPYTIAIHLEEFSLHHKKKLHWSMMASDVSEQMLKSCREANYQGRSINKLPPRILSRYFDGDPHDQVSVKKNLKTKIKFFNHNLKNKPTHRGFDIIFLRNVMIYFDKPTKEKVLNYMYDALKPGGTLIVGESEGLMNIETKFSYVQPQIFVRDSN